MIGTATNREEENHTVPLSLVFLSRVAADDLTPAIATRASQRSRCDEAMDTIKAYIVRKRLHPGDSLPTETELCEMMKTSRSSVREAVSKLEALNIVSVEHGKGTFVGSLSLDPMVETLALRSMVSVGQNFEDLRNVVQLRRFLDIGCADEVCIALHGIPQPELSAIAAQMTQDALAGKTFLREDINFHIGILRNLNNAVAEQMVRCLWQVHMAVLPQLDLQVSASLSQTAESHHRMLDAAIAGNVAAYRQAVIDHYEPIESILNAELNVNSHHS